MKWISIFILIILFLPTKPIAQDLFLSKDYLLLESRISSNVGYSYDIGTKSTELDPSDGDEGKEFPEPRSVLFKSMMVPGWGQISNGQIWKVPIIYGMFVGIGFYADHLNNQYQGYRAAYYNLSQGDETDFKFGPTPEELQGINANQLQSNRDVFRNKRDFMFVVMGLAYGLNILDAYVYAHMRSFDVSDDLSARTTLQPALVADGRPGLRVSVTLHSK